MATYQRVALYILFDAIERDLIRHVRMNSKDDHILKDSEREKCKSRLVTKQDNSINLEDDFDLLIGLDIGEKYDVLMRTLDQGDDASRNYFLTLSVNFTKLISVRNDVMHGRPLTIEQQVVALAFAQELMRSSGYWPSLEKSYQDYSRNPSHFIERSIDFLEESTGSYCIHNLPVPDFDDTGWLPRPALEAELKKKIFSRHPVVSILGDGGNGKTALALQVLHGLVRSNDHDFDAIIWTSAKSSALAVTGIHEVENATINALDIMKSAAILEPGPLSPRERLYSLLKDNSVLLVIDNYETIIGNEISDFAQDVPGKSKILFTSRHPIGGDLVVNVDELAPNDAHTYFNRLLDVYGMRQLRRTISKDDITRWMERVSYKPLSIKWLVLGMKSGLSGEQISLNPDAVLRFCLDNVVRRLGKEAQAVIVVLATLPTPASPSVIQFVSKLTPFHVNDGLTELTRFNLIETQITEDGAQVFLIRSFVRSFIQRIIEPTRSTTERILANFRTLELDFQQDRGDSKLNRFAMKTVVVRNRAEAIIARLLKQVMAAAFDNEIELAEQYLLEAKALDPSYFECHRVEGIVAQIQNDWVRAVAAFKTAITIDSSQPQLHYLLASIYMKMLENDKAAEHFDIILQVDKNVLVLREFARNEYIRCQFDRSQGLINEAFGFPALNGDDRRKLIDVQIQLYVREIEFRVRSEEFATAEERSITLFEFVQELKRSTFDEKMEAHLLKVVPRLLTLLDQPRGDRRIRDMLAYLESEFIKRSASTGERQQAIAGEHVGYLKEAGLKPSYGFIRSSTAADAFIHMSMVSMAVWYCLVEGRAVRYDVELDDEGRYRACNISFLLD